MLELMQGGTVLLPLSIISQILFAGVNAGMVTPLILLAGLGLVSVFGFYIALNFYGMESAAVIAVSIAIGIGLGFVAGL
jgi:hypothetical protein